MISIDTIGGALYRRDMTAASVDRGPGAREARLDRPADAGFLLHAVSGLMAARLDAAAASMGLRDMRDWLVLSALHHAGRLNQVQLSRMVLVDKSTLCSILDRLEAQEFVDRQVDPTDRRARIPRITDAGKQALEQFAQAHDAAERSVFADVPPQQLRQVLDLLAAVSSSDLADA
jgi:DNA-binding MarR family transcriptional regulator